MIELVSLHIPKTGGKSFYEVLKNQYGDYLDSRYLNKHFFPDSRNVDLFENLKPNVKVIHGHLQYLDIHSINMKLRPKIICWLRDPIDRLISNYYFKMSKIINKISHNHRYKLGYTIIDYALDSNNTIYKYLRGIELESLYFAGFLENFDDDLNSLSKKLKWEKEIKPVHINQGPNNKNFLKLKTRPIDITPNIIDELKMINYKDIEIYNRALEIKKSGHWD